MKSYIRKAWLVAFAIILGAAILPGATAFADGEDTQEQNELMQAATSISISPVNKQNLRGFI